MSRPIYPAVYVVVDKTGQRAYTGYGATLIYTRKANAVAKCPKGGSVVRFDLVAGVRVHTREDQ